MIPGGARGVGGRLCPWSRCLTWAKPAKQPPCQGSSPGCKPGQRGQTRGTGDGRAGAVHRGDMPSKTNHQLHFFTQNIVCLSVLPLPPLCPPPPLANTYIEGFFVLSLSHLLFHPFCTFLLLIVQYVSINSFSHIPPNSSPQLLTPSALSSCLSFSS